MMVNDRVDVLKHAEVQTELAIAGNADTVEVMAAVAESEMALQELITVRDKMINAYQEILRMAL